MKKFLETHKVMDYSLLLGVYYETPANKAKVTQNKAKLASSKTVIPSVILDSRAYVSEIYIRAASNNIIMVLGSKIPVLEKWRSTT
jgi:hypothetical protein